MAEFPALPLFTDAYLGDTTHLTTIEHGAYLLLLMAAWRTPTSDLPDDDTKLARLARMTRGQWTRIAPTIREFFHAEGERLLQSRLTDEAARVRQVREQQSQAGRASALKRKGRHSTPVERPLERPYQRKGNENSTPIPTPTYTLAKANAPGDADARMWATAKAYLADSGIKNPGAVIGAWIRDYGKEETSAALTRAQLERAVEPISFVQGCFRTAKAQKQPAVPL